MLLESLRLSASSMGLQGWKFVVVENREIRAELLPLGWNQPQVVDASHLIVLCRPEKFGDVDVDKLIARMAEVRGVSADKLAGYESTVKGALGSMGEDRKTNWLENQVYLALGTLLTTAAFARIDACPMEGFDRPAYDRILGLTEKGLKSVVICPVGFRAEDDSHAAAEKVRYAPEEVIIYMK